MLWKPERVVNMQDEIQKLQDKLDKIKNAEIEKNKEYEKNASSWKSVVRTNRGMVNHLKSIQSEKKEIRKRDYFDRTDID